MFSRDSERRIDSTIVDQLKSISAGVHVDRLLSDCSRWRIGGIADCMVEPSSVEELISVLKLVRDNGIPYIVVGAASNLLFSDSGVRALVIHLGGELAQIYIDGQKVRAECGVWVPGFSRVLANQGLEGMEHMAGIPGTLGGLIYMNGGSQRKGVGDHIVSVRSVSPTGEIVTFTREECCFAYRESIFQRNQHIILDAQFEYERAMDKRDVKRTMLSILRDRRRKFPQKLPNCGSVFVSNPAMYADYGPPGAVIERCGLKGFARNQAQISPMHANFIVNNGGASANDVLYLIYLIRETVRKETGYLMPAEVRYVTPSGEIIPAHEKAQEIHV